jgi:branched-chain amino acid transport system permease protein
MSKAQLAGAAALVIAALFPLAVNSPSYQNTLILAMMIAQLGVAWNILGGYAGQVSLGHAAFFGLGAYTSSLLLIHFGISPWLGMLAGGMVAVIFALLIGWPCFRLKGHYFAIATIAVAEILQVVFTNWEYVGGAVGLYMPMNKQGFAAFVFNTSKLPYYYIALGLLLVTLLASWAIEKSYLGHYFRAIKDEPDAARSLGINLTRYKLVAISASSFLTACGGTLYAQKELFVDPGSVMATSLSVKIALVAILGGVGSLFGPVVGAGILTAIEEATRQIFGGTGRGTDQILYGLLIVVIAVYYPDGVVGAARKWLRNRKSPAPAANEASP